MGLLLNPKTQPRMQPRMQPRRRSKKSHDHGFPPEGRILWPLPFSEVARAFAVYPQSHRQLHHRPPSRRPPPHPSREEAMRAMRPSTTGNSPLWKVARHRYQNLHQQIPLRSPILHTVPNAPKETYSREHLSRRQISLKRRISPVNALAGAAAFCDPFPLSLARL